MTDSFETNQTQALYEKYSALVAPYATTERTGYTFLNSSNDFYSAITTLKSHVASRAAAIRAYLANQKL
jgi:spore coat protein H